MYLPASDDIFVHSVITVTLVCHVIVSLQPHSHLSRAHKAEQRICIVEIVVSRARHWLRRQDVECDVTF